MRCQLCQGKGFTCIGKFQRMDDQLNVGTGNIHIPCPDCNGSGIGHCCDGLQEQPKEIE